MKKIIFVLIFCIMFLLLSNAYSQGITNWERKIYYEAVEKAYRLPKGTSEQAYNNILRQVANKHGLTYGEMKDITDRMWEEDLTEREWQIANALDAKLNTLPKNASKAQLDKAYKEIAKEYGISLAILYDIDGRAWGWWFW